MKITSLFRLLGKAATGGSMKTVVRKTLANVDVVLGYVQVFLAVLTAVLFVFFIWWLVRFFKKRANRQKVQEIMKLLHRIQADLLLLKEVSKLSKEKLENIELSKQEAIDHLENNIKNDYFQTQFGAQAYDSMQKALFLMKTGQMDTKNQLILIDQWLRTIDILCS